MDLLRMLGLLFLCTFTALAPLLQASPSSPLQHPLEEQLSSIQTANGEPKRVAIVGAGISGAVMAYTLHNDYGWLVPLEIVVFEEAAEVGGFVNSTALENGKHGDFRFLETGASIFRAGDDCIQAAIDNAGLRDRVFEVPGRYERAPTVGVWDGENISIKKEKDLKSRTAMERLHDMWKYGFSMRKFPTLMENTLTKFRNFYCLNCYPNRDPVYAIQVAELEKESFDNAWRYLKEAGIPEAYLEDIVQPTVRRFFGHHLADINALTAIYAMDPSAIFQLESFPTGTAELVRRLLQLSDAQIRTNTRTGPIFKLSNGKLNVTFDSADIPSEEFDAVVLASREQRYCSAGCWEDFVEQHVTHITARDEVTLSPELFNVSNPEEIPNIIFTKPSTKFGIISLENSYVETGLDGGDVVVFESLFKIKSTKEISDAVIAELLGYPPDTALDDMGVRWVHRKVWPKASPRGIRGPRQDDVMIVPGGFYTGTAEDILPTLEMNCRLSSNIATLVYWWLAYGY